MQILPMDALLASYFLQSALAGIFLAALWGIAFIYRRALHVALAAGWTLYLGQLIVTMVAAWYGRYSPIAATQWWTSTLQLIGVVGAICWWYTAVRILAGRQSRAVMPRQVLLRGAGVVVALLVMSLVAGRVLHQPGSGPLGWLFPAAYVLMAAITLWERRRTTRHPRLLGVLALAFVLFVVRLTLIAQVILPEAQFPTAGLSQLLTVATVQLVHMVAVGVISLSVAVAYERSMVLDLAAHQQEAERRSQRQQRLEVVGQMAAGIAHDFNNVMTAMVTGVELATESAGDATVVRAELRGVEHAMERAQRLVHRLLAFARQSTPTTSDLLVDGVLEESRELLVRVSGPAVGLTLALGAPSARVALDQTQLEQILLNLVVNARHATIAPGVIAVRTGLLTFNTSRRIGHADVGPGTYVRLDVEDSGIGIPADVLPRIFEPFFTTKAEEGGTGIGLATVRQIVHSVGGELDVVSLVGQGTTISIFLPLLR